MACLAIPVWWSCLHFWVYHRSNIARPDQKNVINITLVPVQYVFENWNSPKMGVSRPCLLGSLDKCTELCLENGGVSVAQPGWWHQFHSDSAWMIGRILTTGSQGVLTRDHICLVNHVKQSSIHIGCQTVQHLHVMLNSAAFQVLTCGLVPWSDGPKKLWQILLKEGLSCSCVALE